MVVRSAAGAALSTTIPAAAASATVPRGTSCWHGRCPHVARHRLRIVPLFAKVGQRPVGALVDECDCNSATDSESPR